jgi:hypothetical protein
MDYENKGRNKRANPLHFTKELFSAKYLAHISALCTIFKLEDPSGNRLGNRLAQHLRDMGHTLL